MKLLKQLRIIVVVEVIQRCGVPALDDSATFPSVAAPIPLVQAINHVANVTSNKYIVDINPRLLLLVLFFWRRWIETCAGPMMIPMRVVVMKVVNLEALPYFG